MRSVSSGGNHIEHRDGNAVTHRPSNDIDYRSGNDDDDSASNDNNYNVGGNHVDCVISDVIKRYRRDSVYDKHRGFDRGGRGEFPPSDRYEGYYLELL